MSSKNSFNFEFLKRFLHLLRIFIPFSCHSKYAIDHKERFYSHSLVVICLILANEIGLQFVIYLVGQLSGAFTSALSISRDQRNYSAFTWLVIRSFGLVVLNAILMAFSIFLSSILYLKWRTRLVTYIHSYYFTKQRYYHLLNSRTNSVDNPDQRITQDVDSLCRTLSTNLPVLLISPFTIGYYTYSTWQVTNFYGPLAIFLYFILRTAVNKIFISAVSRIIFRQNAYEGNFRFLHTQIRTYNEPIAFYNGDSFEHHQFDSYFLGTLLPIVSRRIQREFFLNLSTHLYDYIGSIIAYLLLALAIFNFNLFDDLPVNERAGAISRTYFAAGYLIYRLNILNGLADEFSLIAANTHRVQSFIEYLKAISSSWKKNQSESFVEENQILIIKNLSYSTPNNDANIIMKNLNLILNRGQRLLITGDSGIGKTSLFRILHSLWPINIQGSFIFDSSRAYLLPQRPYFTNRSLFDELSYPQIPQSLTIVDQQQIEQYLAEWNLSHVLNCIDSNIHTCPKCPWQDLLSPGELQRLSFIRLIYRLTLDQYPKLNLIFLDEISSSVDENIERKMYKYLIDRNLTLISIGHRETLQQYHQLELHLNENGNYTFYHKN